ncbi:response regulator [Halosquirtibacter xylanolyticus]|uniref:hybrid sensor histidine kinase/response regulator transcription factor n=1 Tax=Halosquirtibacter xylanolyticus TaxID=3374599 RepID=UPI003749D21D|nr:response regulator [Prolixibacteraceae bacterium]
MKTTKLLILVLLLSLITTHASWAKGRNYLFKKISTEHGLPHSCVYDIQQDSLGYIWFGTHDGVARFDGTDFKYIGKNEDLLSREIRSIYVDENGNVWLAGDKGVSVYDQKKGTIHNFPFFNGIYNYNLIKLVASSKGEVYAVSRDGDLFKYESLIKDFVELKLPSNYGVISQTSSLTIYEDKLLIGTNLGLMLFDPVQCIMEPIILDGVSSPVNEMLYIDDKMWAVATELDGFLFLDKQFHVIDHWKSTAKKKNRLLSDKVRALSLDENRNLWIGTFLGLTVYNIDSKRIKTMQQEFERPYSLSQNSIRSIFEDKEGGMWLGTFFGGVNYYHNTKIQFDLINHNGGQLSLSGNVAATMLEDTKGRIWVGTNDNGVNIISKDRNHIKILKNDPEDAKTISSNNIKSFVALPDRSMLAGTHEKGVNLISRSGEMVKRFIHEPNVKGTLPDNHVYALLKDHQNHIWVGTWKGLSKWKPRSQQFISVEKDAVGNELPNPKITTMYEDRKERIWIGTIDGLAIYYPETHRFESFVIRPGKENQLPSGRIHHILEDHRGVIWIGTSRGIVTFDEINRCFMRPKGLDVLADRLICSIEEDSLGSLWISYNGGLVSYNPIEFKPNVYSERDGLQGRQFNTGSSLKSRDRNLYFGGINGITVFNPMSITEQPFEGRVLLNSLAVNQVIQKPSEKVSVLEKSLQFTKKINLSANQQNFSFSYGIVDYIQSGHIKYRYRLKGWGDDHWIDANRNKMAIFSNIPFGDYIFEVQAIDLYADRKGPVTRIEVNIAKPWYFTIWAYIAYFIFTILTGWVVYRLLSDKVKMRQTIYRERIEKENLEEVNKHKLEFFTNISHEFRTPLTLILSPIEKLLDRNDFDFDVQRQVVMVHKNAKRLLRLVNQVMEFRKAEMREVGLNVVKQNITSAVQDVFNAFIPRAKKQNISYIFDEPDDVIIGYMDAGTIEKILFNLMSNAFKYHKSGTAITLCLREKDGMLILHVEDDGVGIPEDKRKHIFERYYRVNENETGGTGIGLAYVSRLVEIHKGSVHAYQVHPSGVRFEVKLPISDGVYSDVEKGNGNKNQLLSQFDKELWAEDNAEDQTLEVANVESEDGDSRSHIMVVDDNVEIGNYLVNELSESHKVTFISQSEYALKIIGEQMPDVIITDVMMPEIDGVTLCKRIKQNICTCHIPVIMITAKATVEDQLAGLRNGADDFIEKPFSIKVLRAKVENFIKMQHRMKKVFKEDEEIEVESLAFNRMDEEFLSKAKEIVEESLCDPTFTVDRFAREIGMSRSNLHLKMKAILGSTASDYIKKIRFNKALQLLEEQKYTVAEVSYMVGFNTPSYFSTSFKKFFGYLPTEHTPQKRKEVTR